MISVITFIVIVQCLTEIKAELYPKTDDGYDIGKLTDEKKKGIAGHVYFIDNNNILIKNFKYTYPAPDMYFWLDKGSFSKAGLKIPSKSGDKPLTSDYDGVDVKLTVPGNGLKDFDIFGLYCFSYSVNFGFVKYDKSRLPF